MSAIQKQTIADRLEVIILDSCSTDKSIDIAKIFGSRIIQIPNGTFNHGLTRNEGAKYANGKLLYYTVQDAYLSETDQLEKMASHFVDEELQAIVGMQATPHDKDKNPARWFRRFTKPETVFRHFPDGSFAGMPLQEQFKYCSWDNVNAMYRKTTLEKIPFVKTDFAEDWLWVKDALTAKMKIGFDPSLVVYHYHHRDFDYSFKVQYIINYNFYKQFNIYPNLPPLVKPLLSAAFTIARRPQIKSKDKIYWMHHNLWGLLGNFSSHLIFIVIGSVLGSKALDRSYEKFISKVPQGKNKG